MLHGLSIRGNFRKWRLSEVELIWDFLRSQHAETFLITLNAPRADLHHRAITEWGWAPWKRTEIYSEAGEIYEHADGSCRGHLVEVEDETFFPTVTQELALLGGGDGGAAPGVKHSSESLLNVQDEWRKQTPRLGVSGRSDDGGDVNEK